MARPRLPVDVRRGTLNLARGAGIRLPDRAAVPGVACRVVVGVEEQAAIGEIGGRPEPEELRLDGGSRRLRIARPDGAHAPGAVARADEAVHALPDAVELDPAAIAAVLRHPRIVHESSRADATGETRLLNRRIAAGKDDVGGNSLLWRIYADAKPMQRLQDLDCDRTDRKRHPLHVEAARSMQGDLNAIPDDDEGGVCDVQMRIDAEGNRKESAIARRLRIAVEEITVVEVAVGTRKSNRLGGLMNGIVVRLAQHGLPPLVSRIRSCSTKISIWRKPRLPQPPGARMRAPIKTCYTGLRRLR